MSEPDFVDFLVFRGTELIPMNEDYPTFARLWRDHHPLPSGRWCALPWCSRFLGKEGLFVKSGKDSWWFCNADCLLAYIHLSQTRDVAADEYLEPEP